MQELRNDRSRPAAATTAMTTGKPEETKLHASHETRHRVREGLLCLEKENPTQRQWTEHRVVQPFPKISST